MTDPVETRAPERIWAWAETRLFRWWTESRQCADFGEEYNAVEYIRADLFAALVAEAVAQERAHCADIPDLAEHDAEERNWRDGAKQARRIAAAIRALPLPPQPALADDGHEYCPSMDPNDCGDCIYCGASAGAHVAKLPLADDVAGAVEWLRSAASDMGGWGESVEAGKADAAADLIERLAGDRAKIESEAQDWYDQCLQAEADVARMREALREIATDEHPLGWIAIAALQPKGADHG